MNDYVRFACSRALNAAFGQDMSMDVHDVKHPPAADYGYSHIYPPEPPHGVKKRSSSYLVSLVDEGYAYIEERCGSHRKCAGIETLNGMRHHGGPNSTEHCIAGDRDDREENEQDKVEEEEYQCHDVHSGCVLSVRKSVEEQANGASTYHRTRFRSDCKTR